jgi:hypothetical protein
LPPAPARAIPAAATTTATTAMVVRRGMANLGVLDD